MALADAPQPDPLRRDWQAPVSLVRALAIIGIILSLPGLICLPAGLPRYYPKAWPSIGTSIPSFWVALFLHAAGAGLSVLLLLASIGCYLLRSWGRAAMLTWSLLNVLMAIAAIIFTLSAWRGGGPGTEPVLGVTYLTGLAQWILGIILAAFALYVLTRPPVKAAFAQAQRETPRLD